MLMWKCQGSLASNRGKPVVEVVVHSANAVGNGNMMGYINNYLHLNRMEQNCVGVKIEHTV